MSIVYTKHNHFFLGWGHVPQTTHIMRVYRHKNFLFFVKIFCYNIGCQSVLTIQVDHILEKNHHQKVLVIALTLTVLELPKKEMMEIHGLLKQLTKEPSVG